MSTQSYAVKKARLERQRLELWGLPVPEGARHGKNTKVALAYGCDCAACLPSGRRRREGPAFTKQQRYHRLKAAKYGKPVPEGTKHGIYTYKVYGCRCDFCELANRRKVREKQESWRKRAIGSWSVRGDDDVIHWPPVGDGTWTCPECGSRFEMRGNSDARAAA